MCVNVEDPGLSQSILLEQDYSILSQLTRGSPAKPPCGPTACDRCGITFDGVTGYACVDRDCPVIPSVSC